MADTAAPGTDADPANPTGEPTPGASILGDEADSDGAPDSAAASVIIAAAAVAGVVSVVAGVAGLTYHRRRALAGGAGAVPVSGGL